MKHTIYMEANLTKLSLHLTTTTNAIEDEIQFDHERKAKNKHYRPMTSVYLSIPTWGYFQLS